MHKLVLVYGEAYFIFSFIFFSHKYLWRDLSKQKYHEEHKISQLNLKSTKKVKSIHKLSLCCNTYNLEFILFASWTRLENESSTNSNE